MYTLPLAAWIERNSELSTEEAVSLSKDIIEESPCYYGIGDLKTMAQREIERRKRGKNIGIVKYDFRCEKCNKLLGKIDYPEERSIYAPALIDIEGNTQNAIYKAKYQTKCPRCSEINEIII